MINVTLKKCELYSGDGAVYLCIEIDERNIYG